MKQQTAVQWLLNNLLINGLLRLTKDEHPLYKELKDHAKAMEKEQILDALDVGYQIANEDVKFKHIQTTEQYYNEIYGGDK